MELSQISKARKKGRGAQAVNQRIMTEAPPFPAKVPDELVTRVAPPPPVPPGTPYNKIKPWHVNAPRYAAGALAAGAAVGGGAYLYRRKRLERSLS